MADVLTKEQRHKNMQHIKSSDTKIEVLLRKALWQKGYRYRKNYKELPGKPDLALTKYKIAIFCDGEFFHGENWNSTLGERVRHGHNNEYWQKKIERNMARDNEVDQQLNDLGWTVIRFWGNEIKKHPDFCLKAVEECIMEKKVESYEVWSFGEDDEC